VDFAIYFDNLKFTVSEIAIFTIYLKFSIPTQTLKDIGGFSQVVLFHL